FNSWWRKRRPNRCASRAVAIVTGSPSSAIDPLSAETTPARIFISVLFPAPPRSHFAGVDGQRGVPKRNRAAIGLGETGDRKKAHRRAVQSPLAAPNSLVLDVGGGDEFGRHVDHALLERLAREMTLHRICCRLADALEVLRHRGLEIAGLGDRLARLGIGVD